MPSQESEKTNNPPPDDPKSVEPAVEDLPTDLDHASDEDLWKALTKRYSACVMFFAWDAKTKPECSPGAAWSGGFFTAVGLAATGKQMLDRLIVDEVNDWHKSCYPERYITPTDDDENDDDDM